MITTIRIAIIFYQIVQQCPFGGITECREIFKKTIVFPPGGALELSQLDIVYDFGRHMT